MQLWEPGWDTNQSIVKGYAAALDALTAKNPKVATTILSETPYPDKFLTASAGGTPPDLILLVPEQDLAYKQLIKSLDSYMQTAKVNPADFASAGMEQTAYKGHQYMLPLEVDPNFPLVYNKALFQQAGITKPPATMSEADDINQKLFRKNGQEIAQLGMLPPWATYGSTNALYTYFLMFGGGWYDPSDQNKLALTQAGNVNALTWMKKYADQFGGYDAIQNFAKTYGKQGYPDGMGHGLLGMGPMVSANYTTALTTAKGTAMADAFALSLMPVAEGVKADPAWVGGWAIGIPTGAKRPDDSWTVLEWMAASPDGTDTWAEINGFLPGYAKSPYFTNHASDPAVGEYITVLKGAQHPHSVYRLGWSDIPAKAFDDLLLNTVQGKTDISTALQQFETVVTGVLKQYPST
jgi:multiple sugar transport system substrate-binding protein